MRISRCFVPALLAGSWITSSLSALSADEEVYPSRPIQVIVPFGSGGNSDTMARIIQRAVGEHELLPQPLVIQNVPGAGGTIGSRRALLAQPDGYTLLFLHDGIITARFSGAASWGWRDFEPIAATGRNGGIIAVSEKATYPDLQSLLEAAAATPDTITFATNIGAPAHFWAMGLENGKRGARFRFVQTGGGAARFHALKGAHVEVSAFSVAEYLSYRDGGLRALAVLSEERDSALPEVPTAREQGVDLVSTNLQGWWAPKGTDPARLAVIADALEKALATPGFLEFADRQQVDPLFLEGDEFLRDLEKREAAVSSVAPRAISGLPDVPLGIGLLSLLTGIGAFLFRPPTAPKSPTSENSNPPPGKAIGLIGLTLVYVAVIGLAPVPFPPVTFVFLLAVGWLLSPGRSIPLARGAGFLFLSAIISFGVPWLFRSVLGLSMP